MTTPTAQPQLEDYGTIYLGSEINDETCENIIRTLYLMHEQGNLEYIKFIINSSGGDVHHAFAIIDMMKSLAIPIHTYAFGKVCSAALYIFMAGEKGFRFTFKNTLFMSHQWYTGFEGKAHEFISFNKANQVSSKQILDLYHEQTGISIRTLKRKLLGPSDYYFNSKTAVDLAIADILVGDD